jgi:hypothetical protein
MSDPPGFVSVDTVLALLSNSYLREKIAAAAQEQSELIDSLLSKLAERGPYDRVIVCAMQCIDLSQDSGLIILPEPSGRIRQF